MSRELVVNVGGWEIIPEQNLEDKIGYFASIRNFFLGRDIPGGFQVEVMCASTPFRQKKLDLKKEDFQKLMNFYKASDMGDLIGRMVISIYTRDKGELSGFIPMD